MSQRVICTCVYRRYVVDYNQFTARSAAARGAARAGLLWVVEQLPGHVMAADLYVTT